MNTIMDSIRNHIKKMKALGIIENDAELADLLDTSRRRINKILNGDGFFRASELVVMQQYLAERGRTGLVKLSIPENISSFRQVKCSSTARP